MLYQHEADSKAGIGAERQGPPKAELAHRFTDKETGPRQVHRHTRSVLRPILFMHVQVLYLFLIVICLF